MSQALSLDCTQEVTFGRPPDVRTALLDLWELRERTHGYAVRLEAAADADWFAAQLECADDLRAHVRQAAGVAISRGEAMALWRAAPGEWEKKSATWDGRPTRGPASPGSLASLVSPAAD